MDAPSASRPSRTEHDGDECLKEDISESDLTLTSLPNEVGDMGDAASLEHQPFAPSTPVGDGNFEDEFDPILASIRKGRQAASPPKPVAEARQEPVADTAADADASSRPLLKNDSEERVKSRVGVTFAAGLLSVFPEDLRARAGDMMVQSSASISRSAEVFRSALESGVPGMAGKSQRSREGHDTDGIELEEGRGGSSSTRRGAGSAMPAGEEDVRVLSVDELLNDDEVRPPPDARDMGARIPGHVREYSDVRSRSTPIHCFALSTYSLKCFL